LNGGQDVPFAKGQEKGRQDRATDDEDHAEDERRNEKKRADSLFAFSRCHSISPWNDWGKPAAEPIFYILQGI
jgi:hypothetical protein